MLTIYSVTAKGQLDRQRNLSLLFDSEIEPLLGRLLKEIQWAGSPLLINISDMCIDHGCFYIFMTK